MLTEADIRKINRLVASLKKSPPSRADLVAMCDEHGRLLVSLQRAYDAVEKVRGLGEWDPKHVAWENRVYNAERRVDVSMSVLKAACAYYHLSRAGKR